MLGEELATHDTRRYRIVRSIATGGMAQVFEAVWERPGGIERRVALKRMLPEHASDASLRALFFDEARIVSRLVHPNVVQLLDFGMVEGAEFHVLELVDGLDAGEAFRIGRANEAPLGVELATFVMAEVAEALAHAHALTDAQGRPLGIVHRDVSPSNVLVSWSGDVKLGDFGIALGLDRTERTRTGLVRGKEEFMAPEQARGERVDAAADVYALGATWVALVTGDPPRRNAGWETVATSALVRRCLEADPGRRPSAAELAAEARASVPPDARRLLATRLAEVRARQAAPTAFDRALELVLVGGGATREFTAEAAPPKRGDGLEDERPLEPADELASAVEPTTTSGRRWTAAALVALIALGLGLGVWWGRREVAEGLATSAEAQPSEVARTVDTDDTPSNVVRTDTPSNVTPADTLSNDTSTAPPSNDTVSNDTPNDTPPNVPSTDTRGTGVDTSRATREARHARDEARDDVSHAAPGAPDEAPRAVAATGWLRIGGEQLLRGAVDVDGRRVGHAPLERELAVGAHEVVVRDASTGAELLRETVTVREDHRRASPARLVR